MFTFKTFEKREKAKIALANTYLKSIITVRDQESS